MPKRQEGKECVVYTWAYKVEYKIKMSADPFNMALLEGR
jgi:hypothetical protein